jgi:DNA-binding beta-propeller fold protein YncE
MKHAAALTVTLGACVLLAAGGCSGRGSVAPLAPVSALPESPQTGGHRHELLYVSDVYADVVYVYSYPDGILEQSLTGFRQPFGECADAHGNVFIANPGNFDVLEYAHGAATPKATLSDAGSVPLGCAVDPVTGNVAVTDRETNGGPGDVAIYRRGHTTPQRRYTNPAFNEMVLCGYDPRGNLFVNGVTASEQFLFAELPRGGKTLATITLDEHFFSPGGVVWDGSALVVGDESTGAVYRFAIEGSKGTTTGTTRLGGTNEIFQFSIRGSHLIGPNAGSGSVSSWKYPKGGAPIRTISGLREPVAAVISK